MVNGIFSEKLKNCWDQSKVDDHTEYWPATAHSGAQIPSFSFRGLHNAAETPNTRTTADTGYITRTHI